MLAEVQGLALVVGNRQVQGPTWTESSFLSLRRNPRGRVDFRNTPLGRYVIRGSDVEGHDVHACFRVLCRDFQVF